jgi:transposase
LQEVIPVKKRIYRKIPVKSIARGRLVSEVSGGRVVFAVDVAKTDMVASVVEGDGRVVVTLAWQHPEENQAVLELLRELGAGGISVEAAMEPSGNYGDVLRHQLERAGVPVFRVSGKRTHDAAEVYDGVASLHDAKSAAIIAKLHLDGASTRWVEMPLKRRELMAAIGTMDLYQEQEQRLVHKLEAVLARHWPEVTELMELTSATLMALLARIGGPSEVAQRPEQARKLMRGMSHGLMSAEKIEAVLQSAGTTAGIGLVGEELVALKTLAEEAHRALRGFKKAKGRVEALSLENKAAQLLAPEVGKATAAVFVADVGDPREFGSTRAYVKAYGMNLKEKSSGKKKGQLRISKRGPGRARKYLWLAVLRWVQKDRVARAWYERKIARDGGLRAKAVMALMRKYAQALFHMARGTPIDSAKLFDTSRLALT